MDPRRLYILSLHSERTISSFLVDFISSCESSVGLHSIPSATTLAKVNQIDRLFTYVRHVLATPHRCIPLSSNKDPCVSMGDEPDERYPKIRTRMHIYPVMIVQKKRWNKTYRESRKSQYGTWFTSTCDSGRTVKVMGKCSANPLNTKSGEERCKMRE